MTHIFVDGCDLEKNIERIVVHAEVDFSEKYYDTPNAQLKLQDLQEELSAVLQKYFTSIEANILSNTEYKTAINSR